VILPQVGRRPCHAVGGIAHLGVYRCREERCGSAAANWEGLTSQHHHEATARDRRSRDRAHRSRGQGG